METHPDQQLVERFMRNELSGADRRRIVRHLLAGCPRCVEITRHIWSLGDPPRIDEPLPAGDPLPALLLAAKG